MLTNVSRKLSNWFHDSLDTQWQWCLVSVHNMWNDSAGSCVLMLKMNLLPSKDVILFNFHKHVKTSEV